MKPEVKNEPALQSPGESFLVEVAVDAKRAWYIKATGSGTQ